MKAHTEKDIAKKLGKNIVLFRRIRKFSQSDLAYEAEIDLSTLSRLERGVLNVTFSTLYKVSVALNVEIKDLFVIPIDKTE